MTHAHIPTLPQIRPVPKHRRRLFGTEAALFARHKSDPTSMAACSGCTRCFDCAGQSAHMIVKTFCPRHDALAYAMHMAAHATDSI